MNNLPLELVYTFTTGEKLFTYRSEDVSKISSRYYRAIQECVNYITTFGVTKDQWKSATQLMKDRIEDAIEKGTHVKCLMDINTSIDYFNKQIEDNRNASQVILEELFCMFFVLEQESETGYQESFNKKKKELLNSCDEVQRDFFLQSLKECLTHLGITLNDDTPMQVVKMLRVEAEAKLLSTFFNSQEVSTT